MKADCARGRPKGHGHDKPSCSSRPRWRPRSLQRLSGASTSGPCREWCDVGERDARRFLEALEAWVSDAPGWYGNHGQDLPPQGDWTFFARALDAAQIYE
ncbi:DUF7660 family protein [Streptomyces nigra]